MPQATTTLLLEWALASQWAMEPVYLEKMLNVIARHASGVRLSDEEIQAFSVMGDEDRESKCPYSLSNGVATIQIHGVISKRASLVQNISGPSGKACETIKAEMQAAMDDPRCQSIVCDFDTPGGSADGVADLADWMHGCRGKKPMTAIANGKMCSAGYWLASACDKIVTTQDGLVGNIGVVCVIEDVSEALANKGIKHEMIKAGKYKGAGDPRFPITRETRAEVQDIVDSYYSGFVQAVARNRGLLLNRALDLADGRCHVGMDAVKCGLADAVGTFESVGGTCGIYPEVCQPGMAKAETSEEIMALSAEDMKQIGEVFAKAQQPKVEDLKAVLAPMVAQMGGDLRNELLAMKQDVEKTKAVLTEAAQTANKQSKIKTHLSNHAIKIMASEMDATNPFGTIESMLMRLSDTDKSLSYTDATGTHANQSALDIELARIAARKPITFEEKVGDATGQKKIVGVDGKTYLVASEVTAESAIPAGGPGGGKSPLTGKTGKDRAKTIMEMFAAKHPEDAGLGETFTTSDGKKLEGVEAFKAKAFATIDKLEDDQVAAYTKKFETSLAG